MRAFAVLQMVQGHTVDLLLANDYRSLDSSVFSIWFFMRGMTAPIFLFSSGVVFTYLFRLVNEPFKTNPRVKRGFKRFLLLVILGYLLRYPTPTIIDFSEVTKEQWKIFLSVDVLQLIGFGILFLILLMYISEKLNVKDYLVFIPGALIFFILFPVFHYIDWASFLPVPIAAYFYTKTGSLFPLFPWAGYVICGGILGSYLAKHPSVFRTAKFSLRLLIVGSILLIAAWIGDLLSKTFYGSGYIWDTSPNLILLRLGFVIVLNGIISFISLEINSIPRFNILIGRNTLLIYIVHLMILYGSAWNPGLALLFAYSFDVWKTIGTALLMILMMGGLVILINRFKIKSKEVVT